MIERSAVGNSGIGSNILLAVLSGVMLGVSFPPSPLYSTAYVGLVPFLVLLERLRSYTQVLRYTYLMMFVFHTITLYWVGGFVHGRDTYMMISGAALLLIHPAFYWLVTVPYWFIRSHAGIAWALMAFPLVWVAYDYSHASTEFSFPWITLGNSQVYDLYRSQIVEFGSVYALTLLLVAFNVLAFVLLIQLTTRSWRWSSRPAVVTFSGLVLLYLVPLLYGRSVVQRYEIPSGGQKLRVGIIQPNVDPWEKWGEGRMAKWDSYQQQVRTLLLETQKLLQEPHDLVVWPETAIPFEVLSPRFSHYWGNYKAAIDAMNVAVFTGFSAVEYFDSLSAPVTAVRMRDSDVFVDYYNAATLIQPSKLVGETYKKNILVPFAERVPYAETFSFLIEPLKWSVGISGWGKGTEQTVYQLETKTGNVGFSGMICYESVYPHYVRDFVRSGAEFLVTITNDSWWGNTSGAYQHAAYASFRAIETRRWIVRCANGGISGFVDPTGRMHQTTDLYSAVILSGEIEARSDETVYVRVGDALAQLCAVLAGGTLIIAFLKRRRKHDGAESPH